jgi:hypothetical protein
MIPSEANTADARTDQHAGGRIQADQQTLRLDITAGRGYFRPKFRQCYRDPWFADGRQTTRPDGS